MKKFFTIASMVALVLPFAASAAVNSINGQTAANQEMVSPGSNADNSMHMNIVTVDANKHRFKWDGSAWRIDQGGTGVLSLPAGLLIGDGTSPITGATVLSPLTFSAGQLGCQSANASQDGCLSSADWVRFDAATGGGGTPAGSDKEVQFNDAGAFGAESVFTYDKTLDRLSIGGTNSDPLPDTIPLYMTGNVSGFNGLLLNMRAFSTGGASGFGSGIRLEGAGGTSASPAATPAGMNVGAFAFGGFDGTSFSTQGKAQVRGIAEETWTPTAQGIALSFTTTASGGTTRTEKMRITGSGNVGIGTNNPQANLDVRGASNGVLQLSSTNPAGTSCLVMKDSDGSGFSYITVNDGVLSASQTPCN